MANFQALLNYGLQAVKKSVQRLGKSGGVLMTKLHIFIHLTQLNMLGNCLFLAFMKKLGFGEETPDKT